MGIRMGDLVDEDRLVEKLLPILELKNQVITKIYEAQPLDLEEVCHRYTYYGKLLAPHITETSTIVHEALRQGQKVLLEGAQGTMLDPDAGTYPYVTSSSPTAGNACLGLGIGPTQIKEVVCVFKAYTTRVGLGPLPTELLDDMGERIRELGHEYGTTTGRARRCGWFDAVIGRFAVRLNGCTGVAITRLDILDSLPTIKICTAYQMDGTVRDYVPSDIQELEKCQPIYEEMPGWQTSLRGVRRYEDLPAEAKAYLARLSDLIECPIAIVSVGSGREETIICRQVI
jgi:adenylosuccinate synthase